jgi:hypothetical protein
VDLGESQRIALDRSETLLKRLNESVTKIVTSLSVPSENAMQVRLRCTREA